jgi:Peptidase family M23
MRSLIVFLLSAFCACHAVAQPSCPLVDNSAPAALRSENQPPTPGLPPIPLQLEMRVPFEPTVFPSEGRSYLLYELHLTNFGTAPLNVSRIEVLNADAAAAQPIVTLKQEQLETMLQSVGSTVAGPKGNVTIADGRTAIVFMCIAFDRGSQVPRRLLHRLITTDSMEGGAVISAHHTALHVLWPPLDGANWVADDGPSNDQDNHHRRGIFVLNGQAVISRRYAIDWEQIKDGATFSGDSRDVHSYFAYGRPVLAVADGQVVTARDGLSDNIPGHGESFHPAVPITIDTVAGNTITLDLGGGQFAYYMHLQSGSLRVKAGDRVRHGQVLARIGCTGDAREPHLHFEVTTSSKLASGEGVPYLINRYRCTSSCGGPTGLRVHELPLDHSVVDFGEVHSTKR